jgi:L-alanine-DL-glutamate epimerase-like enolase superfamily enzyme
MSRIRWVQVMAVGTVGPGFRYTEALPAPHNTTTIVRIVDEEGREGLGGYDADSVDGFETESLERLRHVVPALLGQDIWARQSIAGLATDLGTSPLPPGPCSAIDIALWDLAARIAGVPLYRLLGGDCATLPAYASLPCLPEPAQTLAMVGEARARGFRAIKLHVAGDPRADVALHQQVRDAHAELEILHDAEGMYGRRGAAYVGAALGELGCRWLEAPLPDHDLSGYRELRRRSIVPILPAGEGVWDLRAFGEALAPGSPWDAIRSDVSFGGGITFAVGLSAVARAFSLDLELASYGHAIVQAANLQAMLGLGSASYFEAPYPAEPWNFGAENPVTLDPDGRARAPELPGLGVQLDWKAISRAAVATFECGEQ